MTHSPDGASGGELDLDELEKVARAAPQCAWTPVESGAGDTFWLVTEDMPGRLRPITSVEYGHRDAEEIAAHIATFDPPTVLKMIAALRALSPSPGLGEEGVHLAPNVRGQEPRSSVLTSTPCQSEEATSSGSASE